MKHALYALCLPLLAAAAAFAEGDPRLSLFPTRDPIYDDLRFVAAASGSPALSFTPPLSRDEIRIFLDGVDPAALAPAALDAYRRVEARLAPRTRFSEGVFALGAGVTLSAEARARTNAAIPFADQETGTRPLLAIPLDVYFTSAFTAHLEPLIALDPSRGTGGGGNAHFSANIPYDAPQIDRFFPFRAFAALGGVFWNIQAGRDRISLGTGRTGNLLLSDTPDFYDFARASVFFRSLKYSALVIQMPLADVEGIYAGGETGRPYEDSVSRYLYVHRLDFKPSQKWSFAVTEALMTGNAPIQLRYLNPLMALHNFYAEWDDGGGTDNSLFAVDAIFSPFRGFSLYAQVIVDEFSTPWETEGKEGHESPNEMGWLAGVEYARSFGAWGAVFYAEAAYTDPYLYVDNSPVAASIWTRYTDRDTQYQWFGYPEGRDMISGVLGGRFFRGDALELSGRLAYLVHGEHGLLFDFARTAEAAAERTPTGTPEHRLAASAAVRWRALPSLTLSGSAAAALLVNAGHGEGVEAGVEMTAGITYTW